MSNEMQPMQPQPQPQMRYSTAERDNALRLLAEVGKTEASRQTGIPVGTIASWGHRHGVSAPVFSEQRQANINSAQQTMAESKAKLAGDLRSLAAKAVAKLAEKIDADDVSARDLVSALTAAVDRLQLLTGEATARIEQTGTEPAQRSHLVGVVHQLAERRVA